MASPTDATLLALAAASRTAARLAETRTLHAFIRHAWPILEPAVPFQDGWHIRALCDHLEAVSTKQLGDVLINLPPGCMKSLLSSVFWPCWVWRKRPETRWLFASYSEVLSVRDSLQRRKLLNSDWYRRGWPYRLTFGDNRQTRYGNSARGWMLATSIGGAGTGEHPDFVVVDDPHTAEGAESAVGRETVRRWWENTILARGMVRDVRRVVVMQRLHRQDLSGHLLSTGGFTHICLPMEYEGPERMVPTPLAWTDPREAHGQLLWPAGFSEAEVRRLKESFTPARYACQIQQRPPDQDVGAEFPASYFGESIWFDDWPPPETHVLRVMSLDPSTGRGEHCDYSAFVLALRDTEGRTWIEADLDRRDVTQLSTRAAALAEAFRPTVLGVEANGFQCLLREPLQQALHQAGLGVDLCEVRATTNKVLRIRSLSPHLARGHLRFRRTPGTQLLVEQLRAFPNAPHDDGPDALEQALSLIEQRSSPRPEIEIDWVGA